MVWVQNKHNSTAPQGGREGRRKRKLLKMERGWSTHHIRLTVHMHIYVRSTYVCMYGVCMEYGVYSIYMSMPTPYRVRSSGLFFVFLCFFCIL